MSDKKKELEFFATNVFELLKYKNLRDEVDLVESTNSFIQYVKEIFPINGVPEKIAQALQILEDSIKIAITQYEISVEIVCKEINEKIKEYDDDNQN